MDLQKEVLELLYKAKEENEYQNPFFVSDLITALEMFYTFEDNKEIDVLYKWCDELYER